MHLKMWRQQQQRCLAVASTLFSQSSSAPAVWTGQLRGSAKECRSSAQPRKTCPPLPSSDLPAMPSPRPIIAGPKPGAEPVRLCGEGLFDALPGVASPLGFGLTEQSNHPAPCVGRVLEAFQVAAPAGSRVLQPPADPLETPPSDGAVVEVQQIDCIENRPVPPWNLGFAGQRGPLNDPVASDKHHAAI